MFTADACTTILNVWGAVIVVNLSGPQPDNAAHKEIAQIAARRNVQGNILARVARLPTSRVGTSKRPAKAIERRVLVEGICDKLALAITVLTVMVEDCGLDDVKLTKEGEKVHDAFAGKPLHTNATEPKFAAVGMTVTDIVPLCPCSTDTEEGFTVR